MVTLVLVVLLALAFDFINGFHDAANSIATVVSTRVLSPRAGRAVGGVLQLRRVPGVQHPRRGEHRQGGRRPRGDAPARRGGPGGRRGVGPPDVVVGAADVVVARAPRWAGRGRRRRARHADRERDRRAARRSICRSSRRRRSSSSLSPLLGAILGFTFMALVMRSSGAGPSARSTSTSAGSSSCRRRSTPSATAATTRRRPWASSSWRS